MELTRRNILSMLGSVPLLSLPALATAAPKSRRNLKVAYFTDIHLPCCNQINARAVQAFKKAQHCDLFLFGGDNLMAVDHQPEDKIQAQFDNWKRFTKKHVNKPHRSILGNHDVELGFINDGTPMSGKHRTSELYGMKNRYWVEKFAGWQIIGLDTVHQNERGYIGHIDDEQLHWLEQVLAADRTTPTMVMGHIPILSVTALADAGNKCHKNSMPVSFCTQVSNSRQVIKLFRHAGNVKLCMSGHTHMNDRCDFGGTTYVCAGSVCGSWWKGSHQGFSPSFTQVDLMAGGEFNLKTVHFE